MCTRYQELNKIKGQIATELQNGFVEKKYSGYTWWNVCYATNDYLYETPRDVNYEAPIRFFHFYIPKRCFKAFKTR